MAAEMSERIGARMKERRIELRLTQAEVADRIAGKTTSDQVSRWERGIHQPQNLDPVATALEVDVSYFYAAAPDKTETPDPFAGTIEERLAALADQVAADRQDRNENVAEIKALIDEQAKALREQAGVLGELRDAVKDLRATIVTQQAAARHLEAWAEAASKALPDGPVRQPEQTGTSRET